MSKIADVATDDLLCLHLYSRDCTLVFALRVLSAPTWSVLVVSTKERITEPMTAREAALSWME